MRADSRPLGPPRASRVPNVGTATVPERNPSTVLCFRSTFGGLMGKAQRFRLGLVYGAIAVLGAAYGIFQHQQAIDWVTDSMKGLSLPLIKEASPFCLLLILALVIYGLFRVAGSLLE